MKKIVQFIMVVVTMVALFIISLQRIGLTLDFHVLSGYESRIIQGFLMTLKISVFALLFSLLIGFVIAFLQRSKIPALRYFAGIYVHLIRGTPLIMQIYLFFYMIGTAWGVTNRVQAGIIILSIFEGAYIAEILRGSYLAIPQSQLQAAKAVGFTKRQSFLYVILPQMFVYAVPALTGQVASIIKDSSLLSIISVIELTQTMQEISSDNLRLFECYLFLGLLYLCLTLPVTFISKQLERKLKYEN